jgi:hypothetical protein
MGTSKPQNVILSEDGELRTSDADVDTDGEVASSDARSSVVFCTHCGTANQDNSRFCRSCGQSLDEQAVSPASLSDYAAPGWKSKRSANRAAEAGHLTPQETAVMIEVMTLLVLGVLAAISIATQQTWIALVLLLIWVGTKLIRRGMPDGH